jgi:hypothetical protein
MRLLLAIILLISLKLTGQALPDSIIITNNTYVHNLSGSDITYRSDNYSIIHQSNGYFLNGDKISKTNILRLLSELSKPNNTDNFLGKYGIDTTWIKNNPGEILNLYTNKEDFEWNNQQKQYIFKELTNLKNYQTELNSYFSNGCCFTMHNSYSNEFVIRIYNKNVPIQEVKSRKFVWGYMQPWRNLNNDTLYNFQIEKKLNKLLSISQKTKEPLYGKKMLKYLVNKIVGNNMSSLYVLSAYTYTKEIEELKTDFEILSFNEVQGRGRYIWNEPATMRVRLKNKFMLDNVNLVFLASKTGKTIYSRDSIKKDYKQYIERIQSINFISDYLKSNPGTKLDIYYFNNKGINEYNIEGVNKNPSTWARHDKWVESLKFYQKNNIKPGFDIDQSIKTSQQNDCGCNYRFERSYIEKAIFFEISDNNKNSSIWFLLPDNKVLLYLMQGATLLNYSFKDFGDKEYMQYPCVLFDLNGQRVSK